MNQVSLRSRIGAMLGSVLIVTALAACASPVGVGSGGSGGGSGGSGSGGSSSGGASGSGSSGSGGSGSPQDITGNWQLVSGTDAKGNMTPGGATVTFTFNGQSSGGHGPCNSFGATATGTTTGTIAIVVGIHTEMACLDPELNATENRYFAALDKVTSASLDSDTLTLTGDGDSLVFSRAKK
jgi:heat shock protein HslJ